MAMHCVVSIGTNTQVIESESVDMQTLICVTIKWVRLMPQELKPRVCHDNKVADVPQIICLLTSDGWWMLIDRQ